MLSRAPLLALPILALALSCGKKDDTTVPPESCTNISGTVAADGLEIRKPEEEMQGCVKTVVGSDPPLARCTPKAPDFGCLDQSEPYGTPVMVTFTGCVASFGLEAQSDDLSVTVLRETQPDGNPTNPGYDLNGAPGQQAERSTGALIGQTISTAVDASLCADRGTFQLANVPTETPLIVRVTDQHLARVNRRYVDTYQYNVVLRNNVVRDGPTLGANLVGNPSASCGAMSCYVVDDVNTVISTTFKTVALAAGVSVIRGQSDLYDGDGQGHLAGEVQDCSSVDRVQNAVVGISASPRKVAYFNVGLPPDTDNLEDPKVEGSRTRTNADGLYAAIAIDAQPTGTAVRAGAAVTRSLCGTDGSCACMADGTKNATYPGPDTGEGDAVALGTRSVFIFPDSITILTFDRLVYTSH